MSEQVPTVGRAVHYVSYGTLGGEYPATCRAATITDVGVNGQVSLCVMNPTGLFFNECVEYDASGVRGGTWHWPERV